ncbi:MAG: hypothetical protein SGJ04_01745 [Bacteroidota bacterium]|nr:hypothetical protein [Bacteroidota bacterium]
MFERIAEAKPKQLFVAADGPRVNRPNESENVRRVRAVIDKVNWDCEVKYLYRDENLGCKVAVSSAISWFFSQVEYGIILEDDCLPALSFFQFCSEILEKYKHDNKVWHINGSNFQINWRNNPIESFYFSKFQSIWGWASWARAWQHYDVNITDWPQVRDAGLLKQDVYNKMEYLNRVQALDSILAGVDTWDFQWTYSIWKNRGLSIIPNVNMISNIGFGANATHTTGTNPKANLQLVEMPMPIAYPNSNEIDKTSDLRHFKNHMKRGYLWRLKNWRKLI